MRPFLALLLTSIIIFTLSEAPIAQVNPSSKSSPAVSSMERKLQHVQSNATLAHPDQTPTEFTEQEINAYFASGTIKLPAGVQSVIFQGQPEVVTATSRVDFDQLKAGRRSSNPLLSMFSGIHDVVVSAHVHGAGGQGYVNVDSVSLDGVEIPRFALEMFVEKYLQPKYPGVGLDSNFVLPDRIDTAKVGLHKLSITQK
jgi:hypothetical protein